MSIAGPLPNPATSRMLPWVAGWGSGPVMPIEENALAPLIRPRLARTKVRVAILGKAGEAAGRPDVDIGLVGHHFDQNVHACRDRLVKDIGDLKLGLGL